MKGFNIKPEKQDLTSFNYIQRPGKQYEMAAVWVS